MTERSKRMVIRGKFMRIVLIILFILFLCVTLLIPMLVLLVVRLFNKDASEIISQHIARVVMKVVNFLAGAKVTVKGLENVPKDEAVLFVPNHRGAIDYTATVMSLPVPLYFVGKKEFVRIPLFGVWVYLQGTLLLDRSSRKEGLKTIFQAIDMVKAGKSILIFPEGTRNKGEITEPLRFKEGSLKISSKSGCKVVPMAITGTREIFEAQAPWIKPGPVTVRFGTPIDPKTLSEEDIKNYGTYVREKIAEMLKEEVEENK